MARWREVHPSSGRGHYFTLHTSGSVNDEKSPTLLTEALRSSETPVIIYNITIRKTTILIFNPMKTSNLIRVFQQYSSSQPSSTWPANTAVTRLARILKACVCFEKQTCSGSLLPRHYHRTRHKLRHSQPPYRISFVATCPQLLTQRRK